MTDTPVHTDSSPEEGADEGRLDSRKLIWRTVVSIVLLLVVLLILSTWFREPIVAFSKEFVENFGGSAIFGGIFLADAFLMPIPHDVLMGFGLLGGMDFWTVVALASCGSLTGGCIGYGVGRKLSGVGFVRRIIEKRASRMEALIRRYGVIMVAIGAVSPLPYAVSTWTAGMLDMNFWHFMLVSLLRAPRFVFYLWLIEVGFMTTI